MFHRTLSFLALSLVPMALAMSCADKVVSCEEGKTCLSEMTASGGGSTTGEGDGGTGRDGGTSSGGAAGDGDGDTGSGGVVIDPCDACDGETSVCVDDECVACSDTDTGACAEDQVCSPDNKCVSCLENSDCTETDASVCDLTSETDPNTCTGCTEHADCEHLTGTPACDTETNTCVACTIDTEAEHCGEFSCSSLTHTCTTTKVGLRGTCEPCESDSECAVDRKCVMDQFQGEDVGYFCFLEQAATGCGDVVEARRPYRSVMELTSIDGEQAQNFCLPPNATTCQGIKDTQSIACTQDTDCGLDDLDDGYCPTAGDGAGACTYTCTGAFDCASGLECGDSPLHCNPAP